MKDLRVNFENLTKEQQEQLLSLVEESQEVKDHMWFEKKQDIFCVGGDGRVFESGFRDDGFGSRMINFGNMFHTKEQAETAAKAMRRFNLILQFAILHDGYREFEEGGLNFCIYYSHGSDEWDVAAMNQFKYECVYMTEWCANLLCKKLKLGEYTL